LAAIAFRVALLLGLVFTCGTGFVLFSDVHSVSQITIDHVIAALVLLGTISAGHYFSVALRSYKFLLALGCAILFVAGTFICVVGSASRGAEVHQKHAAEATKINAQREATERELIKARADRETLTRDFARECASGSRNDARQMGEKHCPVPPISFLLMLAVSCGLSNDLTAQWITGCGASVHRRIGTSRACAAVTPHLWALHHSCACFPRLLGPHHRSRVRAFFFSAACNLLGAAS
jgi:hypothetical protein